MNKDRQPGNNNEAAAKQLSGREKVTNYLETLAIGETFTLQSLVDIAGINEKTVENILRLLPGYFEPCGDKKYKNYCTGIFSFNSWWQLCSEK